MSDAHHLDPAQARSDFERTIILHRNRQLSWRKIAERENISQRMARDAWARANAHQRGGKTPTGPEREDPTIGNEDHARGVPIMAPGIGGKIAGTDPLAATLRNDQRRQREHERRPYRKEHAA